MSHKALHKTHFLDRLKPWLTGCSVVVILCLYLAYFLTLLAHHPVKFFSLIDDGQSVVYAKTLTSCVTSQECNGVKDILIEKEFGRFRPAYWIFQSFIFQAGSLNPETIHILRVMILGSALVVLLCFNIFSITRSFLAALMGVALFVGSYTFAENFTRIGPSDPFQLLALALFSLLFINQSYLNKMLPRWILQMSMLALLAIACLIRETTIAILPVVLLVQGLQTKKLKIADYWWLVLPFTFIFIGKVISKPDEPGINYGGFYSSSLSTMIATMKGYSALIMQMYKWFIIFGAAFVLALHYKLIKVAVHFPALVYWFGAAAAFVAIFLPWQFVLERYLLIFVFYWSVGIGSIIGLTLETLHQFVSQKMKQYSQVGVSVFYFLAFFILSNVFFASYIVQIVKSINYVSWYAQYVAYEHNLVAALAGLAEPVRLNAETSLDNWEVTYELPIHLTHFFNAQTELKSQGELQPGELVLSTSSLIPEPGITTAIKDDEVVAQNSISVAQIDPVKFRIQFRYRPLQTLINPPYLNSTLDHYWELRRHTL